MEKWMENQAVSDVQTAIQSSAIRTAVEANTSKLSDTAFQSFLQNAPIPRVYNNGPPVGTYVSGGVIVNVVWTGTAWHDPYNMQVGAGSSQIRIPIDGFYTINFAVGFTGTANSVLRTLIDVDTLAYAEQTTNDIVGAGVYFGHSTLVKPLRAGSIVTAQVINHGAINFGIIAGYSSFGAVWNAPYNTYTTGSGGN